MCDDNTINLRYPSVVARLLESKGFPIGDKMIQNVGLPSFIKLGELDIICAYLRQLWAEDGAFISSLINGKKLRTYFVWTRARPLFDPSKSDKYVLSQEITSEHVQMIKKFGKFTSDRVGPRYTLYRGKLVQLSETKDERISGIANSLLEIIESSKPQLMIDEREILEKVGIGAVPRNRKVTLYMKTGRVSSLWNARTASPDDTMRTALMAPPEDSKKLAKVRIWVKSKPVIYKRIFEDLAGKGLAPYQFEL